MCCGNYHSKGIHRCLLQLSYIEKETFFGVIKTSLWKEWKTMVNSRAGNRGEKVMLFQDLHVVQLDQDTEGKM